MLARPNRAAFAASVLTKLKQWLFPPSDDTLDALTTLLTAARDDRSLRAQVLMLVRLPDGQREAIVNSAVEEMRLKGEPADIRAAFALLGPADGAQRAADFLGGTFARPNGQPEKAS
ncbi:hypothetical protein [Actomonas aquatica]|uniref:Uncharacterized protein n=1 Tax=Actomonas aquatica TaxID=2866162 RepID=A0ABZ1CEA1_9BACT|nr:hypothetical protein [Opitutus sp. WL0086]WRQ90012.1 hypothetical protein K1X11_011390 [Opitutus sp. WL0086]